MSEQPKQPCPLFWIVSSETGAVLCLDPEMDEKNPRPTIFVNPILVATVAKKLNAKPARVPNELRAKAFPMTIMFFWGLGHGFCNEDGLDAFIEFDYHELYSTPHPPWTVCPFPGQKPPCQCVGCSKNCYRLRSALILTPAEARAAEQLGRKLQ